MKGIDDGLKASLEAVRKRQRMSQAARDRIYRRVLEEMDKVSDHRRDRPWRRLAAGMPAVAAACLVAAAGLYVIWQQNVLKRSTHDVSAEDNRKSPTVAQQTEPSFDERRDWTGSARDYPPGLSTYPAVHAPAQYESSGSPQEGYAASIVVSDRNATVATWQDDWRKTIEFTASALRINGVRYTLPPQYEHVGIMVLPIDHGIVWIPADQPERIDQQALEGNTPIFYTPYRKSDGSITDGAVTIGAMPHRWIGGNGPVFTSAWTGWLPQDQVAAARIHNVDAFQLTFGPGPSSPVTSVRRVSSLVGFPSALYASVATSRDAVPLLATVDRIVRTRGGFVLVVRLNNLTGANAGLMEADYYWSEATHKWTPLTQIYGDQTIVGFLDVGSEGVYWEQPLPAPAQGQNSLYVAQFHYDPAADTVDSIWLGNYFYGPTLVDGASWALDDPSTGKWTVYTPEH